MTSLFDEQVVDPGPDMVAHTSSHATVLDLTASSATTPLNESANTNVPLLPLPAELKNRIYDSVLPTGGHYYNSSPRGRNVPRLKNPLKGALHRLPALLQVCRQTREEASPIYYGGQTFYYDDSNEVSMHQVEHILAWLERLSDILPWIRKISIESEMVFNHMCEKHECCSIAPFVCVKVSLSLAGDGYKLGARIREWPADFACGQKGVEKVRTEVRGNVREIGELIEEAMAARSVKGVDGSPKVVFRGEEGEYER